MYCDGLLNLAHVVIGITITAPMQACIIKANVSALYTTTVFALLVWLRFNWAADDFFNPRLIYATIGLNPIFIEVNAFRTSPYPNTATFYNRGECFCKRIDLLRCRGSNVVGLCVFYSFIIHVDKTNYACFIYCEDKPLLEFISQKIGIPIKQ